MIDGIFHDTMVNMNWTQVQQAVDQKALVLPPLGVIEEHGPHLCLGTDIYTAHITQSLSPDGYLSSPADFEKVDVAGNLNDIAARISEAILRWI